MHFRRFRKPEHAFTFTDDVQFEHALRFVTKAYDVFLSTVCNLNGHMTAARLAPYRMHKVRAIMTTACDHTCRTELHSQTGAPSPSVKL
ncbi:hypothetical protein CXB36_10305 [Pseudomonas syringae pv. syringae]|nr:hypothetical protein BKC06_016200 [Pseudomonas syringae pv. syringae]PBP43888.1 hypothetical protein CCL11_13735 [Pseudomonas syringae]PBP70765.1 hypothetical protein CCL21_10010 [Pseudomonas syringae]PBP90102.1 hypothetical protein CCL16_09330 [Pseudomonas syringae]POP65246.1 hypothetical protein CXB36_10305 [Pseudomonas syringae pv. syringae]